MAVLLGAPMVLPAQEKPENPFISPFDFPLLLSGNFGELRANCAVFKGYGLTVWHAAVTVGVDHQRGNGFGFFIEAIIEPVIHMSEGVAHNGAIQEMVGMEIREGAGRLDLSDRAVGILLLARDAVSHCKMLRSSVSLT